MSALLLLLLGAFINPETISQEKRGKKWREQEEGETHFSAFHGATLKNKCYAIKGGLLNRSVYLYGNNDHLKTRVSVSCRTRKQICMQVLC